jgi:sporulation integral membrane protein YlbJ
VEVIRLNVFFIISFVLVAWAIFFNNKKNTLIFIKKCLLPVFGIAFIAALIIYPKTAVEAASKGIKLWIEIVLPSLFPFFVASQLLSKSGFINIFGVLLEPIMRPLFNVPGCGSFALAMGIVSGYPVGATITTDLRKEKLLSKTEAERLLTFTNNSGPLFIMGAVAVGMFKLPRAGYLLYISHIAACLTVGLVFKYYKRQNCKSSRPVSSLSENFRIELSRMRNSTADPWSIFGECIKNSIFTVLTIGGFIIFFSVLINIIIVSGISGSIGSFLAVFLGKYGMDSRNIEGVICGIFEITTGTNMIKLAPAALKIKLCCASLIIGWAGLSVHAQVISIVNSSDISVKPYIFGKALQGSISAVYTYIGYTLFGNALLKDSPVFFNISVKYANEWGEIVKLSFINIAIAFLIIVCISAAYMLFIIFSKKRLFKL